MRGQSLAQSDPETFEKYLARFLPPTSDSRHCELVARSSLSVPKPTSGLRGLDVLLPPTPLPRGGEGSQYVARKSMNIATSKLTLTG